VNDRGGNDIPEGAIAKVPAEAVPVTGNGGRGVRATERSSIVQVRVRLPALKAAQQLDVLKRFRLVMSSVDAALNQTGIDPGAQKQLGKLVGLVPRIVEADAPQLYPPVEAAIYGLLAEPPNSQFAKTIRRTVADRLRKRRRLAPLIIGLGIGLAVFAGAYTWIFIWQGPKQKFLGFDPDTVTNIALVTITGALGASVSLILRIKDFSRLKDIEAEVLLYTAIFKPILGAAFALFVFMALSAGIINVSVTAGKEKFLYAALAFVAGFSERFARDVISKVAGSLDEDVPEQDGQGAATATLERSSTVVSEAGSEGGRPKASARPVRASRAQAAPRTGAKGTARAAGGRASSRGRPRPRPTKST